MSLNNQMNQAFLTEIQVDDSGPTTADMGEYAEWLSAQDTLDREKANMDLLTAKRPPAKTTLHPSHNFIDMDGDGLDFNCGACDCKPWHRAAKLPCR